MPEAVIVALATQALIPELDSATVENFLISAGVDRVSRISDGHTDDPQ